MGKKQSQQALTRKPDEHVSDQETRLEPLYFKGRRKNSNQTVSEATFDILLFLKDTLLQFVQNISCSEDARVSLDSWVLLLEG